MVREEGPGLTETKDEPGHGLGEDREVAGRVQVHTDPAIGDEWSWNFFTPPWPRGGRPTGPASIWCVVAYIDITADGIYFFYESIFSRTSTIFLWSHVPHYVWSSAEGGGPAGAALHPMRTVNPRSAGRGKPSSRRITTIGFPEWLISPRTPGLSPLRSVAAEESDDRATALG